MTEIHIQGQTLLFQKELVDKFSADDISVAVVKKIEVLTITLHIKQYELFLSVSRYLVRFFLSKHGFVSAKHALISCKMFFS